ncbi:hypothetical protein [Mycolicibacterium confluentis]|uniref:Secreted protein n=1 Tax=Mycolicibacterium confluentis TaxID=28047 RepID=A0A7I7XY25_9MYCO|nr:hypothetical protein [Mycolicibacterium confluentis]MCV7318406.1 hypothetical protein [Mycolicibacterium confluentis]BBZ34054.1 hypothetical protein MCNF_26590 [Mycolicibacterium confluentis]
MRTYDTPEHPQGGRLHIARSRGAASGLLLVLLGLWGALIPFVGPYFDFAYSPDRPWVWTDARGWLEVLPGVVAVLGGLMLAMSRNRATAMLGGWLAVAAGAWFIVGRAFATMVDMGEMGVPAAATPAKTVVLELAFFSGLGALIVFLGAMALGRVSVRSVRDVGYVQRQAVAVDEADEQAAPLAAPMPEQRTEVIEKEPEHRGVRSRLSGMFGRRHHHPVPH